MSDKQVLKYLQLVDRRLYILLNSGINWKPEYGPELEKIDKELAKLQETLETARVKAVIRSDFKKAAGGSAL